MPSSLSRRAFCAALATLPPAALSALQAATIPGAGNVWSADSATRVQHAKIAPFLGREALWLKANAVATRNDVRFYRGTIEFDVAPMTNSNFIGVVFRRQGVYMEENLYLRPQKSGQFDALQYAPHVNVLSTFQLYPQFHANIPLPRDQWTHLRLEVTGETLEVFRGDSARPVLTVPRLRAGLGAGTVGFFARVNERPNEWAAAISNVRVRVTDSTGSTRGGAIPVPAPGTITSWEVSEPTRRDSTHIAAPPPTATVQWSAVPTEEDGLVNLTRSLGTRRGGWTACLRTTIDAVKAGSATLDLAYSDDVTLYLNGDFVFGGRNGFDSRYPGYLGHVLLGTEWVNLNLRPGRNLLIACVSDDNRFGWGLMARISGAAGVLRTH